MWADDILVSILRMVGTRDQQAMLDGAMCALWRICEDCSGELSKVGAVPALGGRRPLAVLLPQLLQVLDSGVPIADARVRFRVIEVSCLLYRHLRVSYTNVYTLYCQSINCLLPSILDAHVDILGNNFQALLKVLSTYGTGILIIL